MAQARKRIKLNRFDGGINQSDKPWNLAVNEAQEMQNVDLERSAREKILSKRRGTAAYYTTAVTGGTQTGGIYRYITNAGVASNLVAVNTDIYKFTSSGTTKLGFTLTANKDAYYTTFRNLCIMVNGSNVAKQYNGSATGTLAGTPPTGAKYVEVYQNRAWMANTSSSPSWMWHSKLLSATNWVATSSAGKVYINPDDGDDITGIVSQRRRLLIFKNRTIYYLYGKTIDSFAWEKLCSGVGCVAPRSIAVKDDNVFFLSDDGVYVLSGESDKPVLLSAKVRPIIEAISSKTTCAGVVYKNQYRLSYRVSGSYNNRELVLNFRKGAWTENRYQALAFNSYFYDQSNDVLWAGSATVGMVHQLDTGARDGVNGKIYLNYKSPALDNQEEEKDKHWQKTYITASTNSATLYLDYYIDFIDRSDQRAVILSSSTKKFIHSRQQLEPGCVGKYAEFVLSDSTGTAGSSVDRQVYSLDIYADTLEDK